MDTTFQHRAAGRHEAVPNSLDHSATAVGIGKTFCWQHLKECYPPFEEFCACGNFATVVKPGPHTGKPFPLCAEHSTLWTEIRLGIAKV
jgi:hypothetical protein